MYRSRGSRDFDYKKGFLVLGLLEVNFPKHILSSLVRLNENTKDRIFHLHGPRGSINLVITFVVGLRPLRITNFTKPLLIARLKN